MKADLHVHTTASDGTLTPAEVVSLAASRGVEVLAIADHDSAEGLPSARTAAQRSGVLLVPAVEFSAGAADMDVHILAYFIDPADPDLRERLSALREARCRRARRMVDALAQAGYAITLDDVLGRSHIARALVAVGGATSVADAFQRLIGRARPFYVAKEGPSPAEVVTAVRGYGAIPVLAHPGVSGADALVDELVSAGLLGIEAYHADHAPQQREHYARIAEERGLLVTGGTDFHGPQGPNPELGSVDVPEDAVRALLAVGGLA